MSAKNEIHVDIGILFPVSIPCQLIGEVLHSVNSFLWIKFLTSIMLYIPCKDSAVIIQLTSMAPDSFCK